MTGQIDVCAICARGLDSADAAVHAWNVAADNLEDANAAKAEALAALRCAASHLQVRAEFSAGGRPAVVHMAMRAAVLKALDVHVRLGVAPVRQTIRAGALNYVIAHLEHAIDLIAMERELFGVREAA